MKKKIIAMLLSAAMCLSLAACGQKDTDTAVDKDLTVNVVSLNGTVSWENGAPVLKKQ